MFWFWRTDCDQRLRRYKRTNDFEKSHLKRLRYISELRNTVMENENARPIKIFTITSAPSSQIKIGIRNFFTNMNCTWVEKFPAKHSIIKRRPHGPLWVLSMQNCKWQKSVFEVLWTWLKSQALKNQKLNSFSIFHHQAEDVNDLVKESF